MRLTYWRATLAAVTVLAMLLIPAVVILEHLPPESAAPDDIECSSAAPFMEAESTAGAGKRGARRELGAVALRIAQPSPELPH